MRPRRSRRPRSVLLALALVASIAELYALKVHHERQVAHVEATALAQVSDTAVVSIAPTATPVGRTPRQALTLALDGALDVMREPQDGRMPALLRAADAGFVHAFEREIDHLKQNDLRLTSRSGYEILSVEQVSEGRGQASLVTQERWVYEEQTESGQVVRCLVEISTQRYEFELRGSRWVVTNLILSGHPTRRPCGAAE